MKQPLTTLCYLEKDGARLLLHRTKKEHDINRDKWIGVGGHFEAGESPEDCMIREVREETGLTPTEWRARGIVTFVSVPEGGADDGAVCEYMHLYTVSAWSGEPHACDEGDLRWVPCAEIPALNLWEGDRIFLRLLDTDIPWFSLKLTYHGDALTGAVLNGRPLTQKGGQDA